MVLMAPALCGGLAGPALFGQDEPAEPAGGPDIVTRSPFLPPGFTPPKSGGAAATKAAAGGYEFRGVYQLGGEYRFLVSPARSRSGSWVQIGKSYDDYEVRGYDASSETLTLYFNNSETRLTLAELEANPTPTPVSGQVQAPAAPPGAPTAAPQPVRRTIRPATRSAEGGSSTAPPPPAWLEKLREEAAARRAQAAQSRFTGAGNPNAPVNPTGAPTDVTIPPPPDMPPPTPPPNLSEIDIPPPPTTLPPPPPPEILQQMQQSMGYGPTPPRG